MLIQLRRVVYLLVLLQCCVCVVSANGEATGPTQALTGYECIEVEKKLTELQSGADKLSQHLAGVRGSLDASVGKSNEAILSANDHIQKLAAARAGETTEDLTKAEEEVQKAVDEATVEVGKIGEQRAVAVEEAGKGLAEAKRFETIFGKCEEMPEAKKVGADLDKTKTSLNEAREALGALDRAIGAADYKEKSIRDGLESLRALLKPLDESNQESPLPGASQGSGGQGVEGTDAVVTPGQDTESAEKPESAVPNDMNEDQSATEKPNESGDSQKPTTPSNTASGSVSGSRDSSGSPALVQSPLLLLLLSVLGSILVC